MFKKRVGIGVISNIVVVVIAAMLILQNNTSTTFVINQDGLAEAANIISNGPRDKKILALTFDDGPHPIYTNEILDLLEKYNVKATFFILGKHGELYPEILLRQKKEGHEIGIHSYNHINMRSAKVELVESEFNKTQEVIYKNIKEKAKVFRPPYGTYNQKVYDIAVKNQCKMVLWTYYQDSRDWSNPGADKIVETVISQARNGDIILFHDHNEASENQTIEAMKIILPELIRQGYKFVTVSQLLKQE